MPQAPQRVRGVPIALVELTKTYGAFRALDQVSLKIPGGALLTLLGPSGCGKSTLLRIIAGFVYPTAGQVLLNGEDVIEVPPFKRQAAMVFQSYALFPHMRVLENVMFGLRMRNIDVRSAKQRAAEALEMVRLSGLADRYPSQLSGGQQQRAALARALVTDPKVLLLDEPFGALDKSLRDEMQVELRKLQQAVGVTTICVTHDQQEAMTISDHVAVMREGRIEQFGTPTEIYDSPRTRFAAQFVGGANILSGVLQHINGRCGRVKLSDGTELFLPVVRNAQMGDQVQFAIRPSTIRLRPRDSASALEEDSIAIPGQIAFSVNLGSKVTYEIALSGGERLFAEEARPSRSQTWHNGEFVTAVISKEAWIVLET